MKKARKMVRQYLDHCREILTSEYSLFKGGSKGVPIISLFGYQNEYDLSEGFPLLTTKKMGIKTVAHELLWFMRGETNIKYLVDNNVSIWTKDAFNHNLESMVEEGIFNEGLVKYSSDWEKSLKEYGQRIKEEDGFAERWGDAGPIYGSQWRHWRSVDEYGNIIEVDQLKDFIETLQKKPSSKKNIVTAWNPGELSRMALESCHLLYQANSNGEMLDIQMYQRSCDQFLGVPFNIASYAMLTQIIAQQAGLQARRFVHTFGDSHFYCGAGERGNWYRDNLDELKDKVRGAITPGDYREVLVDLMDKLPPEPEGERGYDHVPAIIEQLSRTPYRLPKLEIANKDFDKLTIDDFKLTDYDHHAPIRRKMAV